VLMPRDFKRSTVAPLVAGSDSMGLSSSIPTMIRHGYPKNNKGANEERIRRTEETIRIIFQTASFLNFILPIFIVNSILKKLRFVTCFFSIHRSNLLYQPFGL